MPCPLPGDLSNPEIKPVSLASPDCQAGSSPLAPSGQPQYAFYLFIITCNSLDNPLGIGGQRGSTVPLVQDLKTEAGEEYPAQVFVLIYFSLLSRVAASVPGKPLLYLMPVLSEKELESARTCFPSQIQIRDFLKFLWTGPRSISK